MFSIRLLLVYFELTKEQQCSHLPVSITVKVSALANLLHFWKSINKSSMYYCTVCVKNAISCSFEFDSAIFFGFPTVHNDSRPENMCNCYNGEEMFLRVSSWELQGSLQVVAENFKNMNKDRPKCFKCSLLFLFIVLCLVSLTPNEPNHKCIVCNKYCAKK